MSLVNLVFNGKADLSLLGKPRTKDGCWSLRWEDMRVHVKPGVARFKMTHMFVESLDHDFGTYTAHFRQTDYGIHIRVTGRQAHPHCNRSGLCWGNYSAARDHAGDRGDVETIAGLIRTVLQSYNPGNPFPGWWSRRDYHGDDPICITCGSSTPSTICKSCRSDVCEMCVVICTKGDRHAMYCRRCFDDIIKPASCRNCTSIDCNYGEDFVQPKLFVLAFNMEEAPADVRRYEEDDCLPF